MRDRAKPIIRRIQAELLKAAPSVSSSVAPDVVAPTLVSHGIVNRQNNMTTSHSSPNIVHHSYPIQTTLNNPNNNPNNNNPTPTQTTTGSQTRTPCAPRASRLLMPIVVSHFSHTTTLSTCSGGSAIGLQSPASYMSRTVVDWFDCD